MLILVLIFFQPRVDIGMYSIFVREWLQVFPPEQFHFLRLEDYSKDPVGQIQRIFKFLNIGKYREGYT